MRVTKSPFGGAIILMMLAVLCLGPLPQVQAVVPPPDGGYPGGNTAEGKMLFLVLPPALRTQQLAGLQKMSAQMEMSKSTATVVVTTP